MRSLKFTQAINEALDLSMAADPAVYVIGEGVPDPRAIFGTTAGLAAKYGSARVLDMPLSENGLTGVAIGTAITGLRPVLTHQRMDFALLAMDQMVNNAAKWHYMFGGQLAVPLVIRMVVGQGWGQGPQHSQSLQAWFAHVPGLRVVMPATPHDAKGLLIASIEDDNPVIYIEHRWLHNTFGHVPEGRYAVPIGTARIAREGRDVTLAAVSYMTIEALKAAEFLGEHGVSVEVIDMRSLRPLDMAAILRSVRKTGRLLVADTGWRTGGIGAEIVSQVCEQAFDALRCPPRRIGLPDSPTPSSQRLAEEYYPRAWHLVAAVRQLCDAPHRPADVHALIDAAVPLDIPDAAFTGPF